MLTEKLQTLTCFSSLPVKARAIFQILYIKDKNLRFILPVPEITFDWGKYSTRIARVTRKSVPGTLQRDWPLHLGLTSAHI